MEFAYGIVAKRSVDEGRALLKDIIKTLEEAFNVNLSNYTHIFYAIRNRQGDRAVYLKELHDALNAKMDSMDKLEKTVKVTPKKRRKMTPKS